MGLVCQRLASWLVAGGGIRSAAEGADDQLSTWKRDLVASCCDQAYRWPGMLSTTLRPTGDLGADPRGSCFTVLSRSAQQDFVGYPCQPIFWQDILSRSNNKASARIHGSIATL